MYVEREVCLWSHDAVLLAEGELLAQLLQPTQPPGDWQEGVVVQVEDVGLLPVWGREGRLRS